MFPLGSLTSPLLVLQQTVSVLRAKPFSYSSSFLAPPTEPVVQRTPSKHAAHVPVRGTAKGAGRWHSCGHGSLSCASGSLQLIWRNLEGNWRRVVEATGKGVGAK